MTCKPLPRLASLRAGGNVQTRPLAQLLLELLQCATLALRLLSAPL